MLDRTKRPSNLDELRTLWRDTSLTDLKAVYDIDATEEVRRNSIYGLNALERHSKVPLAAIPLDIEPLREVFSRVKPRACGIRTATWIVARSRCSGAVRPFLNLNVARSTRQPLSDEWQQVERLLQSKAEKILISGWIGWFNAEGIEPKNVSDSGAARYYERRADQTLRNKPVPQKRKRAQLWNCLRERAPHLNLPIITVPQTRPWRTRTLWSQFPDEFLDDVSQYLAWSANGDPFDDTARERALSPASVKKLRETIHTAADGLIKSGFPIDDLVSLNVLVEAANAKAICRTRFHLSGSAHTKRDSDLMTDLIILARFKGVSEQHLRALHDIKRVQRPPAKKLTEKNEAKIRPFCDPDLVRRLVELPRLLFDEARNEAGSKVNTLAKLHAALAIGALTRFALRLANLASLTIGVHIDLGQSFGTIRFTAAEVKNDAALEFEIPDDYRRLLEEYYFEFCPALTGSSYTRIFTTVHGRPKHALTVARLVENYTESYLGVRLNPHVFRHLAAKLILDRDPGNYPTVQHLLAHKRLETTSTFYAGRNTLRAGRHHLKILKQYADTPPVPRTNRSRRSKK